MAPVLGLGSLGPHQEHSHQPAFAPTGGMLLVGGGAAYKRGVVLRLLSQAATSLGEMTTTREVL
jgi:hypothetical protein